MADPVDRAAVLRIVREECGAPVIEGRIADAIAALPAVTVGVPQIVFDQLNVTVGEIGLEMIQDAQDAEFTGERPDLYDYVVSIPYDHATAILAALEPAPQPDASQPDASPACLHMTVEMAARCPRCTPSPFYSPPTDADATRAAAQALLDLHDGFLAGRDVDRAAADRLAVASAFGAAAFMACPYSGAEASAMTRAFLLALVNPLHPDLDYLRAKPRIAATEKPHDRA